VQSIRKFFVARLISPIQMGLLVDMSASVAWGDSISKKEAATGFSYQHVVRPGYDKAFVVGFNQEQPL